MRDGLCANGSNSRKVTNMICICAQNLIDLYVQDRLVSFQARWVESHASKCAQCAAEVVAWRYLLKGLRSLPTLSAPTELKATLKAATKARKTSRKELISFDFVKDWWPQRVPSMAMAFSFMAFILSVSASIYGPGVPSQACSNDVSSVCIATPASSKSIIRRAP